MFLDRQCFGDHTLQAEVLQLYQSSTAAIVAALPGMTRDAQDAAAHRLKGSSQGIGAFAMAEAAQALEAAAPAHRDEAVARLAGAFDDAVRAIQQRNGGAFS